MTSWLGIVAIVVVAGAIVGLAMYGFRRSRKSGRTIGELSEREKALQASAERRARMDEILAEPLEGSARGAWDRLVARRRRMRDDLETE